MRLDEDGRLRTIYSPAGTTTGRLSSIQTPWGTGWNSQNAPPWFRVAVIPDPGYRIGCVDLKQAEAVLTYFFAQAVDAIAYLANGGDVHKFGASKVFLCTPEEIHKVQRAISKAVVHGFHYLLGEEHAASMLESEAKARLKLLEPGPLRESIVTMLMNPQATARRFKNEYFKAVPRILEWHEEIREQIIQTRTLFNPFGRRRVFLDRISDDLLRKAVAWGPQSTCVDTTDEALLNMTDIPHFCETGEAKLKGLDSWLLLQIHDEVVFEYRPEDHEAVKQLMREAYDIPIVIHGRTCRIGIEFKWSDSSWGEVKEEAI
jgi:DNA polymerase-1